MASGAGQLEGDEVNNDKFEAVVAQAINDVVSQPPAATPKEAVVRIVAAGTIRDWAAAVARTWDKAWRPMIGHRYCADYAAFLGESLLTHFDLRSVIPDGAFSSGRAGHNVNLAAFNTLMPTKIDQRPNGCTAACIATLTGIPLAAIPAPPEDAMAEWFDSAENRNSVTGPLQELLKRHGWFILHAWKNVPKGFALAGGMSPRGLPHHVVVHDGVLWHDPHESRAGLVGEIDGYDVLMPILVAR